jgi:hypothetical protein
MSVPWVRDPSDPTVRHRGGLPWDERRVPWRMHRCAAHSAMVVWVDRPDQGRHATGILRCACGAVSSARTGGAWRGRNCRRHGPAAAADPLAYSRSRTSAYRSLIAVGVGMSSPLSLLKSWLAGGHPQLFGAGRPTNRAPR